jgi:DNA modification methylase
MTVKVLAGDCIQVMAGMEPDSVDCIVTSPPYWGLRDYGVDGQYGMEPTLGEHLEKMVEVFAECRRVLKPTGTLWLNYGDCYATTPNGRSAADTKAAGTDDRTFRDKPFSTVGPVLGSSDADRQRKGKSANKHHDSSSHGMRVLAGGYLKPKDLCMVPNRLAIALQDAGWWVRSEIIWGKPNAMPDSSGRYRPSTSHEKIFLLTKTGKSFYDAEAVRMPASESAAARKMPDNCDTGAGGHGTFHRNGSEKGKVTDKQRRIAEAKDRAGGCRGRTIAGFNDRWDAAEAAGSDNSTRLLRNYEDDLSPIVPPEVWRIATAAFKEAHFATFPPALVAPCIMAGCPKGGVVLDPFGGSGTVGMVAEALGRESILIDLNAEYCRMSIKRIRRALGRVKSDIDAQEDQGPLFSDTPHESAVNGQEAAE